MCFIFTPRSVFVRVGVSLDGNPSYCDISKLMWRTARPDKGIFLLFMPPLRHFNLKMLNILISLFFFRAGRRFDSYIMLHFFFPPPQRTAQQAKERSQMRKSAAASKVASDISRFFIRKWSRGLGRLEWMQRKRPKSIRICCSVTSEGMGEDASWQRTHSSIKNGFSPQQIRIKHQIFFAFPQDPYVFSNSLLSWWWRVVAVLVIYFKTKKTKAHWGLHQMQIQPTSPLVPEPSQVR